MGDYHKHEKSIDYKLANLVSIKRNLKGNDIVLQLDDGSLVKSFIPGMLTSKYDNRRSVFSNENDRGRQKQNLQNLKQFMQDILSDLEDRKHNKRHLVASPQELSSGFYICEAVTTIGTTVSTQNLLLDQDQANFLIYNRVNSNGWFSIHLVDDKTPMATVNGEKYFKVEDISLPNYHTNH